MKERMKRAIIQAVQASFEALAVTKWQPNSLVVANLKVQVENWNNFGCGVHIKLCDGYEFEDLEQIRVLKEVMEQAPSEDGWHIEFQDRPFEVFNDVHRDDPEMKEAFVSMYGNVLVRYPSLAKPSCDDESIMIVSGELEPVSAGIKPKKKPYIVLGTLQEVWGFYP